MKYASQLTVTSEWNNATSYRKYWHFESQLCKRWCAQTKGSVALFRLVMQFWMFSGRARILRRMWNHHWVNKDYETPCVMLTCLLYSISCDFPSLRLCNLSIYNVTKLVRPKVLETVRLPRSFCERNRIFRLSADVVVVWFDFFRQLRGSCFEGLSSCQNSMTWSIFVTSSRILLCYVQPLLILELLQLRNIPRITIVDTSQFRKRQRLMHHQRYPWVAGSQKYST